MVTDGWQPIKTKKPDNCSTVLAFWGYPPREQYPPACFGVATYENGTWHNPDDDDDLYSDPTHWMPLPPPPGA